MITLIGPDIPGSVIFLIEDILGSEGSSCRRQKNTNLKLVSPYREIIIKMPKCNRKMSFF